MLESLLVFINANRKIRKRMDTVVAFTRSIPRYRFPQGMRSELEKINVVQGKVFLWVERGFLRFFQDKLDNQGLGLLCLLTLEQQYLYNPRKD